MHQTKWQLNSRPIEKLMPNINERLKRDKLFVFEFHFSSAILRKKNHISFLEGNGYMFAIPISNSRTNSQNLSRVKLHRRKKQGKVTEN